VEAARIRSRPNAAAGAYNQRGPSANGQNIQNNQNNQSGGRQAAVQAQQGGQSSHGVEAVSSPDPSNAGFKAAVTLIGIIGVIA
jgi:hypothetical protein